MTKFTQMKFHVVSEEQSEELQQILFEQGYTWSGGATPKYTDAKYLFTDLTGYLTFSRSPSYFRVRGYVSMNTEQYIVENSDQKAPDDQYLIQLQETRNSAREAALKAFKTHLDGAGQMEFYTKANTAYREADIDLFLYEAAK